MKSHVGYALNGGGGALPSKPKHGGPSRAALSSFVLGGVMRVSAQLGAQLSRHLLILNLVFFILMVLGLRRRQATTPHGTPTPGSASDDDTTSSSWIRAFWIISLMRGFACFVSFELAALFLGIYTQVQEFFLTAEQREALGDVPLAALCVLLFCWALPGWSVARMQGVGRRQLQGFLCWNCKSRADSRYRTVCVRSGRYLFRSVLTKECVRRHAHVGILPLHRRSAARRL